MVLQQPLPEDCRQRKSHAGDKACSDYSGKSCGESEPAHCQAGSCQQAQAADDKQQDVGGIDFPLELAIESFCARSQLNYGLFIRFSGGSSSEKQFESEWQSGQQFDLFFMIDE